MKEIKVVCLCRAIRIADLKLNMTQGDEIILSQGDADRSLCLDQAVRARAVQVFPIERFREKRDPKRAEEPIRPVQYRPIQSVPKVVPLPVLKVEPPEEKEPKVDEDALAEKIRKLIVGDVAQLLDRMGGLEARGAQPGKGILVEDNTPTFIPTGLVSKDAKVEMQATETTQGGDDLSAAVAALKKRRTRKTKEEGTNE